jgi:GNAT superfamily N-acetyltransferase
LCFQQPSWISGPLYGVCRARPISKCESPGEDRRRFGVRFQSKRVFNDARWRMSASPVKIRSATVEDSGAVTDLLKSIHGVWQPDWRSDSVHRSISAADGLAFFAVEQDQVIGFICGHDLGFRAYLSEFAVAESHQRAGIGTALLGCFEEALAQRGCHLVVADVYPPAEPFYRTRGWGAPSAILLSHRLPT